MVPKTENTLKVSAIDAPIAFPPRDKSKLQPSVKALCDLIDVLSQSEIHIPVLLTEIEYQELAARLDDLLDIVGEENHPLGPLLHFVGTLVENYEDEHLPKLTDI